MSDCSCVSPDKKTTWLLLQNNSPNIQLLIWKDMDYMPSSGWLIKSLFTLCLALKLLKELIKKIKYLCSLEMRKKYLNYASLCACKGECALLWVCVQSFREDVEIACTAVKTTQGFIESICEVRTKGNAIWKLWEETKIIWSGGRNEHRNMGP